MGYYLADGIHPKWATFMKSIPNPQGKKQFRFHNAQAAAKMDVLRAFGILLLCEDRLCFGTKKSFDTS